MNYVINSAIRIASGHDSFKEIRKLDGFNEILNVGAVNKTKKLHHHKKMFLSFSHHRFCVVYSSQPRPWMDEVYGIFNQNSEDKISLGRPNTPAVRPPAESLIHHCSK